MEYVDQKIVTLFENGKRYQNTDNQEMNYTYENEKIIYDDIDDFFSKIQKYDKKRISIITGCNGIGKSKLTRTIANKFSELEYNTILIELKKYNSVLELQKEILPENDVIVFDGLDEININILNEMIEYIFSIKNINVIVSSRKDFLQKNNMLNENFNIYEIMKFEKEKVDYILSNCGINKNDISSIYNLMLIPRFLEYIVNNADKIADNVFSNKYDILDFIVNKHLEILNERSKLKIEKNIHKKILQSMALTMMITGKMNFTIEEFVTFLSKMNYLDIKSYILNQDIIDNFLNNQLLLNDGDIIQFENKEIMEFLCSKEIIENQISNKDLYEIVTNEKGNEIDSLWFNTITYLVAKSKFYKELILNYIYNNLEEQDSLIELLFNIEFQEQDSKYVERIIIKLIRQYTKLYQYINFYKDIDSILKILSVNFKGCLTQLQNVILQFNFNDDIDQYYVIYINNILSCIEDILNNYVLSDEEKIGLEKFFVTHEQYFMNNKKFNVRFLDVYMELVDYTQIDRLILKYELNNNLFSHILYHYKNSNKLINIDQLINKYIINHKEMYKNGEYFVSEKSLQNFIIENYNTDRVNKLLNSLKTSKDISGFLKFTNKIEEESFWKIFDEQSIVEILYKKIIYDFLNDNNMDNAKLNHEILFGNIQGTSFEKILKLTMKYNFVKIQDLSNITDKKNFVVIHIYENIIKLFLQNNVVIEEIYNILSDKKMLFNAWKFQLNLEQKKLFEKDIEKLFSKEYIEYIKQLEKTKNKEYVELDNEINDIERADNVFYKIEKMYDILKDENKEKIIFSDSIIKNRLKKISQEIERYIKDLDIEKLKITYNKDEGNYTMSYIFLYYDKALAVMNKFDCNIELYNRKSIVMLEYNYENLNINYSDDDYNFFISYLKKDDKCGYIRQYLYIIIEKLKDRYINELIELILGWLENIELEEYHIIEILNFLYENVEKLNKTDVSKLEKYADIKPYQDLMILLKDENEIEKRVKYIKEKLVFEGDKLNKEKNGNFEYSSGYYTNPLTQIGISNKKYIIQLIEFTFEKYNQGNYYGFAKYILDMAKKYIQNNINYNEINEVIEKIVELEKKNVNRYLYIICNSIKEMKRINAKSIDYAVKKINCILNSDLPQINSYDELYDIVENILKKEIFKDIKRMKFFEIFKDEKKDKIKTLKEETYQYLIGYELERTLIMKGYNTISVYESAGFDKKRCDIQLISEGFIQNIVIETKLTNNSGIGNEMKIKEYVETTLNTYKQEFNSPKILFVLINQTLQEKTCAKRITDINNNSDSSITPILIDLKEYFK